jgi:putative transcriptional regulator
MSNKSYYEELKESLEDAIAFEKGDKARGRVTVLEIPISDFDARGVSRVREKAGLTQTALAKVLGVSSRTVEAWESGRNTPAGPSKKLLYLIDKDQRIISEFVRVL